MSKQAKQENPHFHKLRSDLTDFARCSKSQWHLRGLCFVCTDDRNYGWTDHAPSVSDSDYGKFRKVVVAGSCHSRCMMMSSEADWLMLKQFEKAKSMLTNAHIESYGKKRIHS